MKGSARVLLGAVALATALACGDAPSGGTGAPAASTALTMPLEGTLPSVPAAFAPSSMKVTASDPKVRVDEVESCASCHADAAAQWQTSVHAFGSFDDPIYRASVLRFRTIAGNEKSRFCGGCHDASLMVAGAMDKEVAPDDSRAHAGITCRVCHGIEAVRPDGNASFDLRLEPIPLPKEGDPASVARHKAAVAPAPLRTSALCGSCHRAFLDTTTGNAHHVNTQDELGAWQRSAWAGQRAERLDEEVDERTCAGCHMQKEPATRGDQGAKHGQIASHRFSGTHTWLAAMRGDPGALAREQAMVRGAATIDVAALRHEDGRRELLFASGATTLTPGERVTLDVVARNTNVGHRFPGGVLDADDVWFEVVVEDADGKPIARAGADYASHPDTDDTAHVLRAVQLDDAGKPVLARETERFRIAVTNHTIAPRDAELTEYAFVVPDRAAFPLRVRARLRHRTRSATVQALACDAMRTAQSKAFAQAERRFDLRETILDPCMMQPITDVAEASVSLGARTEDPRDFQRAYDYALGLSHVLQERLDEGRDVLAYARAVAATPKERAMALALLANLAGHQGRPEEALSLADEAEAFAPGHPALLRIRGEALAQVWRFDEAAVWLDRAARRTPLDDVGWSRLAVVLGSANRSSAALDAARSALALFPRDADALRVQSLSLDALGAPQPVCDAARDAFLERRVPDDGPAIKAKCSKNVPGCALERDPVHVHPMRQ